MDWCHQATSHYLNKCQWSSVMPFGSRGKCVKANDSVNNCSKISVYKIDDSSLTITHCLGLVHEKMVCTVCLSVFLTHWGRVMHKCFANVTIIGSDNGLTPGRHQAIIWTNAGIWLIGTLWTNFSEILIQIHTFSFNKMRLKRSSAKWQPFSLGLNVLSTG